METSASTYFKRILFLVVAGNICTPLVSQNLEKVGKKDMLKMNGAGLNFNSVYYNSQNLSARRDPFTWYLSGNINFSFLDVSLPFTYSYSNQQGTFSQPFNQVSIAPQYKWFKAYIGSVSMTFSPYTLAGHVFTGAGAELTPGHWKVALMGGRLKKAVEYDFINNTDASMSYTRIGYGAKAGYENNGHGLMLIYFTARDDQHSLKFIPGGSTLLPQENTAVSLAGKVRLFSRLSVEGEYALSGFTRNSSEEDAQLPGQVNYLPLVFSPRANSKFFSAYKGSLNYSASFFSMGLNYEHIAPEYKTLGGYYFTNDIENITVSPSVQFFKGKLNLNGNSGLQRNNLDNSKWTTNKRLVNSFSISGMPSKSWNISASYSNFSSYTNVRPRTDPYQVISPADTLNFYQVSQNANAMLGYNFTRSNFKHGIILTASYQVATERSGHSAVPSTIVTNMNFSYSLSHTLTKFTSALGVNANTVKAPIAETMYIGPNLNLGKSFFNNWLQASAGAAYNTVLVSGSASGSVMNYRLGLNITPKVKNTKIGKPSLGINSNYVTKFETRTTPSYNELTAMLNLNYSF